MKVRFIFTTAVQVGTDVWVQRYLTKDTEVPDDFVPGGFTTVGVQFLEEKDESNQAKRSHC